jgi:hypothetical protein
MADPRPTSDIDQDAQDTLRLSRRFIYVQMVAQGAIVIVLAAVVGVLLYRAIGERSRTDAQVKGIVSSQCGFDYPVAIAPVDPKATSKLGLQLVEGARTAVMGLGCPQHLTPPSAELIQLGKKYGVPIRN